MLPATRTRTSFLLIAALGMACPAIAQDKATPNAGGTAVAVPAVPTLPAKGATVPATPLLVKKGDGAAAAPKAPDTIDPKAKAPALGAKAIKLALDNAKDNFIVYYYGVAYGQQTNDPKMTLKCVEDANRVLPKSEYKDNEGLKKFLGEAKAKAEASLKTKS